MDRYSRVALTVIALCLVWLCVNTSTRTVRASEGMYAIEASAGGGFYRLNTQTGDVWACVGGASFPSPVDCPQSRLPRNSKP